MSKQIALDSEKSKTTIINYSSIRMKWEDVVPIKKIKSNAGEIPYLFKKKRKKISKKKPDENNRSVSLSSEALTAKENYETKIVKRIQRMKYYPLFARRRGNEGTVVLKFTLGKEGSLKGNVSLEKECAHGILNKAGVTTIKRAGPFPSFPEELAQVREEMTFIVNLEYSLRVDGI
jgi:TonB family protein